MSRIARLRNADPSDAASMLRQLTPDQREQLMFLWEEWARPEQLAPSWDWVVWLIKAGRGWGKALALDTPIPTPLGWTTMGAVQVGDTVLGADGVPTEVTFVSAIQYDRPCYRVVFSDGCSIVADADHQWAARSRADRRAGRDYKTKTTKQIKESLTVSNERNWQMPAAKALLLPIAELPIDPWVLGFWLGDGSSATGEITIGDQDSAFILDQCAKRGAKPGGTVRRKSGVNCATYPIGCASPSRAVNGRMQANGSLSSSLRALGLIGNKQIPAIYLRASKKQREDLLAGLIDSDGYVEHETGRVEITTIKFDLGLAIRELACTLGHRARMSDEPAMLNGKEVSRRYRIRFIARSGGGLLPRKQITGRLLLGQPNRLTTRYVESVDSIKSVPVRCISVAAKDCLYLAGNDFLVTHNTRVGAEQVREWVKTNPLVNLIGATADDARDIMIAGESGILAICPRWERPRYVKNERKLKWPNGAESLIFTADEPDRMRGKQHMKLWCLVGETKITMGDGLLKQIADIRAGDFVLTRKGARRVLFQTMTNPSAKLVRLETLGGQDIVCTDCERVFTYEHGFTAIRELVLDATLCVTNASFSITKPIIVTEAATTQQWCDFTLWYGKLRTALYQRVSMFITKTKTKKITNWITLNCSVIRSIQGFIIILRGRMFKNVRTQGQSLRGGKNRRAEKSVTCFAQHVAMFTIVALRYIERFVLRFARIGRDQARLLEVPEFANGVLSPTQQFAGFRSFVLSDATRLMQPLKMKAALCVSSIANNAETLLKRCVLMQDFANVNAHLPITHPCGIRTVEKLATCAPVYDITIEGEHEFFANGILVHNCDELAAWRYPETWTQALFGLRLGRKPQAIVTTTPRPTAIIKELVKDPTTHVTNGATKDNAANLASVFIQKITAKYEGTRLGRQELSGEILDDNPNALFQRQWIDDYRVTLKEFADHVTPIRWAVAIDPSVSAKEDSDLCGIVAGCISPGLDGRMHLYVTDDESLVATPRAWARTAVALYHRRRADRIVAEINNGGDLVQEVLRAVDTNIAYRCVHATRGKVIRAEPVSALYEQGRVHHVGSFAKLEDEQCDYDPINSSKSPDRMDALVWLAYELMIGPQGSDYSILGGR